MSMLRTRPLLFYYGVTSVAREGGEALPGSALPAYTVPQGMTAIVRFINVFIPAVADGDWYGAYLELPSGDPPMLDVFMFDFREALNVWHGWDTEITLPAGAIFHFWHDSPNVSLILSGAEMFSSSM